MSYYIPSVGAKGPLRSLNDVSRAAYDSRHQAAAKRREALIEAGLDPDAEQDIDADAAAAEDQIAQARALVEAGNLAGAREALSAALSALGTPYAPPPPFEPDEALGGIRVRLRAISAAAYARTMDTVGMAAEAEDMAAMREAQAELVGLVVDEVQGVAAEDEPDASGLKPATKPEHLAMVAGDPKLLNALFLAARTFQELDPNSRRSCGVSQPQT